MKKISALLAALALGMLSSAALADHHGKGEHKMAMHDCTKAPAEKKAMCEAHNKAMEACKDKKGDDHKKCMHDNMPKKDDKKGGGATTDKPAEPPKK